MTLWHEPTETARGHGLVVIKKGKNIGVMTAYEHQSYAPASRWCYLTELLKLEQENPKQDAEKMAETLLMLTKMGAKGHNILELLVEKYKEGNN